MFARKKNTTFSLYNACAFYDPFLSRQEERGLQLYTAFHIFLSGAVLGFLSVAFIPGLCLFESKERENPCVSFVLFRWVLSYPPLYFFMYVCVRVRLCASVCVCVASCVYFYFIFGIMAFAFWFLDSCELMGRPYM